LSYVGINSVGLRRRGFQQIKIREIQDIYRILYQKKLNTTQALGIIEANGSNPKEMKLSILSETHLEGNERIHCITKIIFSLSNL
jgi:UDP-N-acetylglucosamine acyltransferase